MAITRLDYAPSGRTFDVEIFLFSDLARRLSPPKIQASHRYDFHLIILVTDGKPVQQLDFEPIQCGPQSVLIVKPGQVHSFGMETNWDGWLIIFRSEFIPATVDAALNLRPASILNRLPSHIALCREGLQTATQIAVTMARDARDGTPSEAIHTLLRYQLCTLVLRLGLSTGQPTAAGLQHSPTMKRFARFCDLVEEHFPTWHQVRPYADALGCTEKSLNRSTRNAADLSPKDFISQRIILEAKRLLAHSSQPIYLIAADLGFDEPTNFAKFFRRKAGKTPVEFRDTHR